MISIDYNPEVISYDDLLTLFWSAHRCDQINFSKQYMNAIFYHNEEQKKAAEKARTTAAKAQRVAADDVQTSILPVGDFTYAENYHQKYYLGKFDEVRDFLTKQYPDAKSLADSTVATRLNAFLNSGMKKDWKVFLKELPEYGLPTEIEFALKDLAEEIIASEG